MPKYARVKEIEIAQASLDAARPVVSGTILASQPGGESQDLRIELTWSGGKGRFAGQVVSRVHRQSLPVAIDRARQAKAAGRDPLLLARYVAPQAAEELRQRGIAFMDTAGNAFVQGEGLLLWVVGKRPQASPAYRTRAFTPAGLKLLFVFLSAPDSVNWTQRRLADAAGIALGGVGRVIKELMEAGFVERSAHKVRRIANPQKLHGRWESGYLETLRPVLLSGTYRVRLATTLDDWIVANAPVLAGAGAMLGGEAGAALLTESFRPARAAVHVHRSQVADLIRMLNMVPDPRGNLTVIETFGERNVWRQIPEAPLLVDPLLMRAEMLTDPDERLVPASTVLLQRYILERFGNGARS